MSSDRCFFALFLIIHAFLISALLPGGGFIVLLLIIDVSIISSYGVNCKGKPTVEVLKMCKVFGAGFSYIGGVVAYYAGKMFWEDDVTLLRGIFLLVAYFGILCWIQFPYQYYKAVRKISKR